MSAGAAQAVLAAKSKSFALAARLLPPRCRDDVAVLYAYCRRADDAVDECPPGEQAERVQRLRRELHSVYAGETQTEELLAAFQRLISRYAIPLEYPSALLDGLTSDIGQVRIRTTSELLLYAHRVAGVVGLMLCHVFGLSDRRALENADHLGIAMQLTNICRDVMEDWGRDRLYLPADLLLECGAETPFAIEPRGGASGAVLSRVVERLLGLADHHYRQGDAGLYALPFRVALSVRAARRVYAAIGRQLERRAYDVSAGRAVVPGFKKCVLILGAVIEETLERVRSLVSGRKRWLLGASDGG